VPVHSLTIEQTLILLTEAPPRIAALTAGLTRDRLRADPNNGGWSANDVLAHLRSCADVWGGWITALLAQDHPTLRAVNPRTWIEKTDYLDQDFQPSLQAFAAQRAELLAVLEPLPPESWACSATVTGAGKALERTVHFYAGWLAAHERAHIKQIQTIANAMRMR